MIKPSKILPRSLKLYFGLLVVSTGLILYGTLFPVDYEVPHQIVGLDKIVHILMFGAWSFFYGLVRFLKERFSLLPVLLMGSFFGLLIEILQHLLPTGRTPELMDFVADLTGTVLAVAVLYIIAKKVPDFKAQITS